MKTDDKCRQCGDSGAKCAQSKCCIGCNHPPMTEDTEIPKLEMGDPQELEAFTREIVILWVRAQEADGACACPVTQQHFALARDLLNQAATRIRITALHQVTALTMARG